MIDKVIRPTFGKKGVVKQALELSTKDDYTLPNPDAPQLEGEALERAQIDLLYMLEHTDYISGTRDLIHQIGDYIFSLKDFTPNGENIRLRREGLRSSTLEDLCAQVRKSNEQQWKAQPSFFGALTLEYHYRVEAALSLMPE